ncbi:Integrase catalytic domain-containing protein, partial [Aphis craccivora]
MNKIICNCLTHYVNNNQKNWALYYKMVVLAYNTYPHARIGHSQYYLMFGTEATQPLDNIIYPSDTTCNRIEAIEQLKMIREELPKLIKAEQNKQKKNYDKSHETVNYSPGQMVLIYTKTQEYGEIKKLAHKFKGPFKIIEKISDVNYKEVLTLKGKPTIDII